MGRTTAPPEFSCSVTASAVAIIDSSATPLMQVDLSTTAAAAVQTAVLTGLIEQGLGADGIGHGQLKPPSADTLADAATEDDAPIDQDA